MLALPLLLCGLLGGEQVLDDFRYGDTAAARAAGRPARARRRPMSSPKPAGPCCGSRPRLRPSRGSVGRSPITVQDSISAGRADS